MGRPSTFEGFCETFNVKPHERPQLVWHLAAYRARRTVETLLAPPPPPAQGSKHDA